MSVLADKVVVVTGASSGIGEATAERLAQRNARLVLTARRADRIEQLADRIVAEGGHAVAVPGDVADRDSVRRIAETAMRDFGRIDVLINNAGIMPLAPMARCRVDDWSDMIDVNVKGVLHCIAEVMPVMLDQKSGHIVNVSSVAGHVVFPNAAVYCATKSAVNAISYGLRSELAEQGHQDGNAIRVSVVSPGVVATELRDSIRDEQTREDTSAYYDSFEHPLTSQDIADAILYMLERPAHVSVSEMIVRPSAQVR